MNEERKLKKVKIDLMRDGRFALMSGVIMTGKCTIEDDLPTACTDGYNEMYGRELVRRLPTKQLAFVVAHEAGHKLFRHLTTWHKLVKEDAQLANVAMDHVVNLMLLAQDPNETLIAMPRYWEGPNQGEIMGVADPRFQNMNVREVYDILRKEQKQGQKQGQGQQGQGQQGQGQQGQGQGQQQGKSSGGGFDTHDHEQARSLTEDEHKAREKELDQAVREGLIAAERFKGSQGGDLMRRVGDLLAPKVNWREVLRDFVKSINADKEQATWRKFNRRALVDDIYLPAAIGERMKSIVIGIDTSGSIAGDVLTAFLSEVQGIAEEVNPETVHLLYWDSRIAAHEEYQDGAVATIAQSTRPKGGGGTSPSCVSAYLKDKLITPECIVMLTDGVVGSDWGSDWDAPLIWVVHRNAKAMATTGTTIHIEDT